MPGAGPVKVITDKGILAADADTGELVLAALYPGVEADEVRAGVGWPLRSASCARGSRSSHAGRAAIAAGRARSPSPLPQELTRP